MKKWVTGFFVGCFCLSLGMDRSVAESKPLPRVFEMRTYYANEGKMDALHARFRDHTCKLFEKHGMTLVGFWSPTDEAKAKEMMVYILAFPSELDAKKSWQAFVNDPEWKAAKAASEKNGGLVKKVESVFLKGTDYSAIK
ncbi:MAG: NIPSNAP family protein [Zavarzinella sp.]